MIKALKVTMGTAAYSGSLGVLKDSDEAHRWLSRAANKLANLPSTLNTGLGAFSYICLQTMLVIDDLARRSAGLPYLHAQCKCVETCPANIFFKCVEPMTLNCELCLQGTCFQRPHCIWASWPWMVRRPSWTLRVQ